MSAAEALRESREASDAVSVSPTGRRVVATAAGATAVMAIALMVAAGELIPGVVAMAAVFAALALGLLRSEARWLLAVCIVLPLVALATSVPFIVSDLAHPESAAGFVPQLLLSLVAPFTAFAAAVTLRGTERYLRPVAVAFGAVAVLGTVTSLWAALALTDDALQEDDVRIVAESGTFPTSVTIGAGGAGLYLENGDRIRHTFVIEGAQVHQEMPGSTARRLHVDLDPGSYRYFCDVPGHEGMEGTLEVG